MLPLTLTAKFIEVIALEVKESRLYIENHLCNIIAWWNVVDDVPQILQRKIKNILKFH
jgi:hypothetical protein